MQLVSRLTKQDFDFILANFDRFWPGRDHLRQIMHPVYLYQFGDTAFAIHEEGQLVAYLLGFVSPQDPPEGYIHMVAAREDRKGAGLGTALYRHFENVARVRGASALRAITSSTNSGSLAFHKRMGFQLVDGGAVDNGVPVVPDYSGPGLHRVVMFKRLLSQGDKTEEDTAWENSLNEESAEEGAEVRQPIQPSIKPPMSEATLEGATIRVLPLGPDSYPELLKIYQQCEDFLALGPQPKASMEMVLTDMALSAREGGRFCGIYTKEGGRLIGVADFVPKHFQGNPKHACLFLVMIARDWRSRGVGSEVVRLIESEIGKDPEVEAILSGVQVNNPEAIRFWERMGYRRVSEPELMPDGTTVYHLKKRLGKVA